MSHTTEIRRELTQGLLALARATKQDRVRDEIDQAIEALTGPETFRKVLRTVAERLAVIQSCAEGRVEQRVSELVRIVQAALQQ